MRKLTTKCNMPCRTTEFSLCFHIHVHIMYTDTKYYMCICVCHVYMKCEYNTFCEFSEIHYMYCWFSNTNLQISWILHRNYSVYYWVNLYTLVYIYNTYMYILIKRVQLDTIFIVLEILKKLQNGLTLTELYWGK